MQKYAAILILLLICSCGEGGGNRVRLEGRAQGTMYRITFYGGDSLSLHKSIDSIFIVIDKSLSLYNDSSVICRINRNETNSGDYHLLRLMNHAIELAENTGGKFDFTIGVLAGEWKLAQKTGEFPNPALIDSLLGFTGYRLVSISGKKIIKKLSQVQIDLNAIAQGYTVDMIAEFLNNLGIEDYIIELGGEVKAAGSKPNGEPWAVGIERPPANDTNIGDAIKVVELKNESAATSGSFRQRFKIGGMEYSHIIDPKTGRPAGNNLLSVTVISKQCADADALATAFMAMGAEQSIAYITKYKGIRAYFTISIHGGGMEVIDKTKSD